MGFLSQNQGVLSRKLFAAGAFIAVCIIACPGVSLAERAKGGGGESSSGPMDKIGDTQRQRASERFDILSWIRSNKEKTSAQDRKWGSAKSSSGIVMDLAFTYLSEAGDVTRQVEGSGGAQKIGKDTTSGARVRLLFNNLFTAGNKSRSYNLDVGFEVFSSQLSAFTPDPTALIQTERSLVEKGVGLVFRPFGRSSQDTSLMLRGGYVSWETRGIWTTNTLIAGKATGFYLGGDAKIYLLPILGLEGEYWYVPQSNVTDLAGKWTLSRFRYGAFIELWLLHLGAFLTTQDSSFTDDTTATKTKENFSATGLTATLFF